MADGKSSETNRFAVPYNPNLPDDVDQPSTSAEVSASIRRHPSASPLTVTTTETFKQVKNTGK